MFEGEAVDRDRGTSSDVVVGVFVGDLEEVGVLVGDSVGSDSTTALTLTIDDGS